MAAIAAVNSVGESVVALLRSRRDLLAVDGPLGPVPAALEIAHASLSRLATAAPPTAGLTLSCTRGFIDPDDLATRLGGAATPAQAVRIEAGRTHTATIAWTP